jgi:hypothetical protein
MIRSIEKSSDLIGNRTLELPACSKTKKKTLVVNLKRLGVKTN